MSSTISTGLPENWTIRISKTHNQEYYFDKTNSQSTWNPPSGTDEVKLNEYLAKNLHRPTKVRARHLLIKHSGSRRPASWKEQNITRSKEEAIETLKGFQEQIKTGEATLEQLSYENSDCNSHAKGGDLGFFGKGEMQPAFERVAFGLQAGEVSDIVETDSGVHLIERVE